MVLTGCSSTNMLMNFVLAKAGLTPQDVSFIGVGSSASAVAAIRNGQLDALKKQAAQIQKVSAQLEMSRLAPHMVINK